MSSLCKGGSTAIQAISAASQYLAVSLASLPYLLVKAAFLIAQGVSVWFVSLDLSSNQNRIMAQSIGWWAYISELSCTLPAPGAAAGAVRGAAARPGQRGRLLSARSLRAAGRRSAAAALRARAVCLPGPLHGRPPGRAGRRIRAAAATQARCAALPPKHVRNSRSTSGSFLAECTKAPSWD